VRREGRKIFWVGVVKTGRGSVDVSGCQSDFFIIF
jgi:hypothetical protein